jgi:hypothetical protein
MTEISWTWASIITALGDTSEVAEALSLAPSIVSGWKTRGIPGPRWASVVKLAGERDRSDISLEVMAELAAREFVEARA